MIHISYHSVLKLDDEFDSETDFFFFLGGGGGGCQNSNFLHFFFFFLNTAEPVRCRNKKFQAGSNILAPGSTRCDMSSAPGFLLAVLLYMLWSTARYEEFFASHGAASSSTTAFKRRKERSFHQIEERTESAVLSFFLSPKWLSLKNLYSHFFNQFSNEGGFTLSGKKNTAKKVSIAYLGYLSLQ